MEGNGLIMHSNPAGTKKVYLTSICAAKTAAQQPIAVGESRGMSSPRVSHTERNTETI